ncbi:MAG: hypothetical protein ACI4KH_00615 [Oscillospiraceae bacterium]
MKKLILISLTIMILTACTAKPTSEREVTTPIETTVSEIAVNEISDVKAHSYEEQKLLDLSQKKISEYKEEDFVFLLDTDFSCYMSAFDTDVSENMSWGKIRGSSFSYFFFPTNLSAPLGVSTGISYSGYDVKPCDLSGTPEMIIIDFDTDLISDDEIVSGKFRKGMSLEDVQKIVETEECVFTDERLSKDYTYYKTYGENLEYRLLFSESGKLSEIQIKSIVIP